MPLWENVGGTPKKLTSLWENVGGTPTKYVSFKENVDGTFKELLQDVIAHISLTTAGGSNGGGSDSSTNKFNVTSGWSYNMAGGGDATGVTGYTYFCSHTISEFSPQKDCTLTITGTYSGTVSVLINDVEMVSSSPISITKNITPSDIVKIVASASWGYTSGSKYDIVISLI